MRAIIVGLLIGGMATGTPALAGPKAKKLTDLDRIQGEWVVVELESWEGVCKTSPYTKEVGSTFYFVKDTLRVAEGGGAFTGTFSLDPTAKRKTIDCKVAPAGESVTWTGIYSFKGDTLVIVLGKTRPKDINSKPTEEGGELILRLKRPML